MTVLARVLPLAAASFLTLYSGFSTLVAAATYDLACSPAAKLQAKIDSIPAGVPATINLTGTCYENVVVPQGKTINVVGAAAGSGLVAADGLLPALASEGNTTLTKLVVTNVAGTARSLVEAVHGGSLTVLWSDLSAPHVAVVVDGRFSDVTVVNSRVLGGSSALQVAGGSTLTVRGDASYPAGPSGLYETYVRSLGSGVNCMQGGTLVMNVRPTATAAGYITIEKSGIGLTGDTCDLAVVGDSPARGNLRIQNNSRGAVLSHARGLISYAVINGNSGHGLTITASDLEFVNSNLKGNDMGIYAKQSRVGISNAGFDNRNYEVSATLASSIHFYYGLAPSSFAGADFQCSSGSRIDIDYRAIYGSIGSQPSCVYQYGP